MFLPVTVYSITMAATMLDPYRFSHYSLSMVLERITSDIYWVLIGILVLNLFQKRHHKQAEKKRVATLGLALLVLLLNVLFVVILTTGLPHWSALIALVITGAVAWRIRKRIMVFSLKCPSCGIRSDIRTLLFFDDNLCTDCRTQQEPAREPAEPDALETKPHEASHVDEIDWDLWEPDETAVLCYIVKDSQVLLIHKKTGLGKGLINAPGGRINDDETAAEAAVRECREETGIMPLDLEHRAILNFQFTDGYSLRGHVFFASDCSGDMQQTAEADPFWIPVSEIPYDQMWEDDRHWLPRALDGTFIIGKFIFDGETMVSKSLAEGMEV